MTSQWKREGRVLRLDGEHGHAIIRMREPGLLGYGRDPYRISIYDRFGGLVDSIDGFVNLGATKELAEDFKANGLV